MVKYVVRVRKGKYGLMKTYGVYKNAASASAAANRIKMQYTTIVVRPSYR